MAFSITAFGGTENTTDAVTNTSSVTWSWTLKTTNGSYDHTGTAWYRIWTSDGSYDTGKLYFNPGASSGTKTKSYSRTTGQFAHNGDGSLAAKTFNLDFYENPNNKHYYASYVQYFTTYARYANITYYVVNKVDENTLNVVWSADASCDWVQYRIKPSGGSYGSWINGSGTNFNIGGLTAGTTYYIQIQVRRQDSGLWTQSGEYGQSTHPYPYCNNMPNFTIGNNVTLGFYNPLGRSITYEFLDNNNNVISTNTITGQSDTLTPTASDLYSSIPNSISANYKVKVTYGTNIDTRNGGAYSVDVNNNKPTFENFELSYAADHTSLTNDDQVVIDRISTVTAQIDADATAQNGASISSYTLTWGDLTPVTISDISQDTATLVRGTGNVITVTAYDSRNLNNFIDIPFEEFIQYLSPNNCSINTHRRNGVESTTYLDVDGTIYYDTFGTSGEPNEITSITYTVPNGATDAPISLSSITYDSQSSTTHTQRFHIENASIHEDGSSGGFDPDESYQITVKVIDSTGNYSEISGVIKDGKFAEHWTKDSSGDYHFGCNGLADDNYTAKFYGKIWADNIYPVGSIYMNVSNVDPNNLFPGTTWTRIEDKFLLCAGSTYSAGSTGGAATVTLTANQSGLREHSHGMAGAGGHNHQLGISDASVAKGTNYARPRAYTDVTGRAYDSTPVGDHTHTIYNQGPWNATEAHENMPPYLSVYCWKRVS